MTKPKFLPNHEDSNGWWEILPEAAPARVLSGEKSAGMVVIGAGVCGLAATRRLAELRPDEEILLIEAGRAGHGVSGRNAGFMLNMHSHGAPKKLDVLRRNHRFWTDGVDSLRKLVKENQIQCDWSEWGRFYGAAGPDGEKNMVSLAETLDALEQPYEHRTGEQMARALGTTFYHRGLHVSGNGLVNPAALIRGLAKTLPSNVVLFEDTPVINLSKQNKSFHLETPEGSVIADRVVLTTGVFLQHMGVARNRYAAMSTYASLSEPLSDEQLEIFDVGGEFGLLATSENGATVRLTRDKRLFFRNHFTHDPSGVLSKDRVGSTLTLHREGIRRRWPMLADVEIRHTWGGTMAFTTNDGTVFGEIEPNLFAALTHDISPMTRGTSMGQLLADLMEDRDSPLLRDALDVPHAAWLPPRPFLDVGVAWELHKIRRSGASEF